VKARAFTVELDSSRDVERVMVPNGTGGFLVEGNIGRFKHASFVEDSVLEVMGTRGILRVDLSRKDFAEQPPKQSKGASIKNGLVKVLRAARGP
jgi:hypothetical protein